jgi:4-amino-4-deoxy-L-arabinose transferase-like glycosyltransferase
MTERVDDGSSRWEFAALIAIGALAGWLRLRQLELAEFKFDEATAVALARRVLDGDLVTAGLTSSIGAENPPLFVYLTAIPLVARDDPLAATAFVGGLGTAAVILTYVVLRPRLGALVALGAAALFATSPWAVLYGRKLWGQSLLPLVAVMLLWSLLAVLERSRTRAVAFVPVLLCVAFQLNFSAFVLVLPAATVLLYRVTTLHWRWLGAGVVGAVVLLSPWLYHEATSGFDDVSVLLPGGRAVNPPAGGPSAVEAIRHTVHLLGLGNWEYVSADSLPSFVDDAGPVVWKGARGASILAALLFAVGVITCAVCVTRSARRIRRWPWVDLGRAGATRALLLIWLVGVWIVYATPATDRLYPHYLIVTFPVSFVVQAVGLADLTATFRRGFRTVAMIAAVGCLGMVVVANAAFTLSFHRFLDRTGGTAGDYGVVYRDKEALAAFVRAHGSRVSDDDVVDFLVTGDIGVPRGNASLVTVTDRIHNLRPPCAGELRSFGPLDACVPP